MTAGQQKFRIDLGWQVLLRDLGVAPQDLLRQARLPLDLFSRRSPSLTTHEYYRLFDSLGALLDDPAFPLRLGRAVSPESFSPPIFACLCCPDLNVALSRLAQYKPLIGPLRLDVRTGDEETVVLLGGLSNDAPPPASLIATELVFLVQLARTATREPIAPKSVHVTAALPDPQAFGAFFGAGIRRSHFNGLSFRAEDAMKPFLTANEAMWLIFEPELRTRMDDLESEAPFRDRVRACLTESLASGLCSMEDVARRLAVSARTLQRRLHEEGTSFQQVLNGLREQMARHYLANSHYSSAEISFLLGYDDPNSFTRAFHSWTGMTPDAVRRTSGIATHSLS